MERLGKLLDQFTLETMIPAVVLALLFSGFALMLAWAQLNTKNRFDVADFFRDEKGKASSGRAFAFVALAIHSWWVATLVFQKLATVDHFLYYGLIWAGTPAVMMFASRWGGNLPFSQPGYAPTSDPAAPAPPVPPSPTDVKVTVTQ